MAAALRIALQALNCSTLEDIMAKITSANAAENSKGVKAAQRFYEVKVVEYFGILGIANGDDPSGSKVGYRAYTRQEAQAAAPILYDQLRALKDAIADLQ